MQKTFTVDCISKKVRKNNGELPIIYVEDHHEPIISKTVFQWVQTERKRRAGKRKVQQKAKTEQGKYSGKYALTERLVCGECGTAYRRCTWNIRGKRKIVWRCISRLEYGKKYCHNSPTIEESRIQDAILRAINGFIDSQTLKDEAMELVKIVVGGEISEGKTVAQMQQEVSAITDEEERLLDLLLEDMDDLELNQRMQTLMAQKTELLQSIEQTKADMEQSSREAFRVDEIRRWISDHKMGLQEYDDIVTRRFVEKVTVVSDDLLQIKMYDYDEVLEVGISHTI